MSSYFMPSYIFETKILLISIHLCSFPGRDFAYCTIASRLLLKGPEFYSNNKHRGFCLRGGGGVVHMIGGILSTLQNLRGGFVHPFISCRGCYVHPVKNMRGVLSTYAKMSRGCFVLHSFRPTCTYERLCVLYDPRIEGM